jgi:hypothetical protein
MDDNKNKECTVEFEPSGLRVKVASGTTLLEAAHGAGVYLSSVCGGESMMYLDLMSNPDYMDEFIKAKFLPHTDLSLFPSVRNLKHQAYA